MRDKRKGTKKEDINVKLSKIERGIILSQVEVIKKMCNLKDKSICAKPI